MKNLISILSILLIVLIGFTAIAQKPEQMVFKERLSDRKSHHFNEWKSKSHKDAKQTKGLISKPGNSENYYWFETEWEHSSNTEYSYNTKGFLTERLQTNATSGENQNKNTWAYDSHDNQTENIGYNWNDIDWEIYGGHKNLYTYDANGNITENVTQYWEEDNWTNSSKDIYDYDNNGVKIGRIHQEWENNSWANEWKITYATNNQGEWIEIIDSEWENNSWVYIYRETDIVWHNWELWQRSSYKSQVWNVQWINFEKYNATFINDDYVGVYLRYENNIWVNYRRETYTKSQTERIRIYEYFENKGWANSSRHSQFFDEYESYTGSRDESWENDEWVVSGEWSNTYTYNENNDITEEIFMIWNPDTLDLENFQRHVYSNFQYFESGVNDIISLSNVKVFPNPVGDILNIEIQNKNLTEAVFQIMNITGQIVYEGIVSNQLTSKDIKSLSTGVYILHIQTTDNRILNYKILKD